MNEDNIHLFLYFQQPLFVSETDILLSSETKENVHVTHW